MAGIYIHIPFCKRKCHYCNFFSLASQKLKSPFLTALKQEISMNRDYLGGEPVNTLYFGGGTPSLCDPAMLQEVMEMTSFPDIGNTSPPDIGNTSPPDHRNTSPPDHRNTSPPDPSPQGEGRSPVPGFKSTSQGEGRNFFPNWREITLEINPDDVTKAYVVELQKTWFNRVSIGIQSFFEEDLKYLNRTHSAEQALRAVKLLQDAGYSNISIDLIYGIPTSNQARWQKNLDIAFSLDVPHISAYALTVEVKTPLAWMIERQKSAPVSDELQEQQFRWLIKEATANGYQQYEISNFCKPGHHALHNTNYWKGIPYLGLGPSAHSYNGSARRWNISNLSSYIDGMAKGQPVYEEEILSSEQKYNEYVMTSLRTMWGCNLKKISYELQITNYKLIMKRAASFVQQGWLTEHGGVFFLTDEGKLFADLIASELFVT